MFNQTIRQPSLIALLLAIAVTLAMLGGFIGTLSSSSAITVDTVELQSDQSQKNCITTHYESYSQQCSSMQGCLSGHLQCTGIPVNQAATLSEGSTEFSLTEAIYSSPFSPISIRPPIV